MDGLKRRINWQRNLKIQRNYRECKLEAENTRQKSQTTWSTERDTEPEGGNTQRDNDCEHSTLHERHHDMQA